MMLYCKGDRVRYLGKPEWGPGRVLGDSRDGKARVLFTEAGVKLLVLKYARLMKVRIKTIPAPNRFPPTDRIR
jgi:hypothetical protein